VLAATANVPETVLDGTVARVDGELAEVDTAVGTVRGLHDDAAVGDAVQVRIGADAVTIYKESQRVDPDSTSAWNCFARRGRRDRGGQNGVDGSG